MPERFSLNSVRVSLLAIGAAVAIAAGCTESYDGGGACPSLCPVQQTSFRDTIIEAVTLDTTLAGFPTLGLSATMLIANRPDTLVTRGVLRYDGLPTSFRPNNGADTLSITVIDSVFLKLPLDSTARAGTSPVTLSVFDVDTTASDSVTAVVRTLFRSDRLLGTLVFTPSASKDSIRVTLNRTRVGAKVAAKSRLRLGLAITDGTGQVRIRAFELGRGAPTVTFDPSNDTTYAPVTLITNTAVTGTTDDAALAYQAYTIVEKGSDAPPVGTLVVGGFPAYRSYLRFVVPPSVSDSGTIVRAELLITQRPSRFGSTADSVAIVPLIPTSSDAVTDIRRILDLSAEGAFASLDTTRLVPRDSGQRVVNVLNLVRSWRSLAANVPRALAFRINGEGGQSSELRFFSSEAAASLRPRLRITYLPRTEGALP